MPSSVSLVSMGVTCNCVLINVFGCFDDLLLSPLILIQTLCLFFVKAEDKALAAEEHSSFVSPALSV